MKKSMMTPRLLIWLAVAGLCVLGLTLHIRQTDRRPAEKSSVEKAGKTGRSHARKLRSSGKTGARSVADGTNENERVQSAAADAGQGQQEETNALPVVAKTQPPLTPSQKKAQEMRSLLDDGDERAAMRQARELLTDDDPDVRAEVATVLGWIGLRALPELSQMLNDPEDHIADDVMVQWTMAYNEIEDPALQAEMLAAAMKVTKVNAYLEELAILSSQLPETYGVAAMVEVIEGPNPDAAAVAREHYEFMTQEPYSGPDAAAAWLRANGGDESDPQAAMQSETGEPNATPQN